jgi:hypothetical protein
MCRIIMLGVDAAPAMTHLRGAADRRRERLDRSGLTAALRPAASQGGP